MLIDAGLCRREIVERLCAIGERPECLDAILLTHEHSDHMCGLLPFLRKYKTTVYMSRLTAPAIPWGDLAPALQTFQAGECFCVGCLAVRSFTIPHDAADPVGFCIEAGGVKIGVATDLGYMPESVKYHLRGVDLLVLEANHDLEMLKVGPYPWSVKQRVMGRNGHLSNEVVCDFIVNELHSGLRTLVLGHLSEHNNHPALVHMSATRALRTRAMNPELVIAEPRQRSQVFEF